MKTHSWKLKEIIMVGIIGVLFALISFGTAHGISIPLILPFAAAGLPPNYSFEVVWGIFFMSATIAAYIIRKPGVSLGAAMLAVLIQFLMGNATGPLIFLSGLVTGLGAEVGFAVFRYKTWNWASLLLAVVACTVFSFTLTWWTLGYHALDMGLALILLAFFTRLTSGIIFACVIVKLLADGLARAGVLKSYPVGANVMVDTDE